MRSFSEVCFLFSAKWGFYRLFRIRIIILHECIDPVSRQQTQLHWNNYTKDAGGMACFESKEWKSTFLEVLLILPVISWKLYWIEKYSQFSVDSSDWAVRSLKSLFHTHKFHFYSISQPKYNEWRSHVFKFFLCHCRNLMQISLYNTVFAFATVCNFA